VYEIKINLLVKSIKNLFLQCQARPVGKPLKIAQGFVSKKAIKLLKAPTKVTTDELVKKMGKDVLCATLKTNRVITPETIGMYYD
jgi:hypothetical protein